MEEWGIDTPEVVANAAARGWVKAEEMGEEDSIVFGGDLEESKSRLWYEL